MSVTTTAPTVELSDDLFAQIRDFIYSQSGLFFPDHKKYVLEGRLAERLKALGLKTFEEYYYYVRYDPGRERELAALFDSITTNETSFFRNAPQLDSLRTAVLPEVIEGQRAKGDRRLRIWSAGCSSGEEPYTLSIITGEVLGEELSSWFVEILATDISTAMLTRAQRGVYSEYSLRNTPEEVKRKYFLRDGPNWSVKQEVRKLVRFGRLNLSDDAQMARVPRMNIIFCRNVLIYFDPAATKKVVDRFYDILLPGGYLFIGHSESLHGVSRAFKLVHFPGAIVYKKET